MGGALNWFRKKASDRPAAAAVAQPERRATIRSSDDSVDLILAPRAAAQAAAPAPARRRPSWLLPGLLVAGGIGAIEVARRRFQHSQLYLPERYPDGIWDPRPYGVVADDVWFDSADGTRLHGWWLPTRRARGTVLYCHGNSGNITSRIGVFRYLRQLKVNVFAFDYRGYGRSAGVPSEQGLFADARAAWDQLVREVGEAPQRIVLFGHSLGGAVAIDLATRREPAALVVQSSFTSLKEIARERFPSVPLHLVASRQYRSIDKVARVLLPKLFIHGASDETIPFTLGRRLFEHAAEPKEWYPVAHAGHSDVYRYGGFRYLWKVSRFLKRALSG